MEASNLMQSSLTHETPIPRGARFIDYHTTLRSAPLTDAFLSWQKCNPDRLEQLLTREAEEAAHALMAMQADNTARIMIGMSRGQTPNRPLQPVSTNRITKRKQTHKPTSRKHASVKSRAVREASATERRRAVEHIPKSRREAFGKIFNKYSYAHGSDNTERVAHLEKVMGSIGVRPGYMKDSSEATEDELELDWKLVQAQFLVGLPLLQAWDKAVETPAKNRKYQTAQFQWLGRGKDVNRVGLLGMDMTKAGFFDLDGEGEMMHRKLWDEGHLRKLMHDVMEFEQKETSGNGFWDGSHGCVVPKTT